MQSDNCSLHKTSFNKDNKKQVRRPNIIQTLRHAMTQAQEADIKLKNYEGSHNDDPSVMQTSSITQSEIMAIQGQTVQPENTWPVNQGPMLVTPRYNWKANLTCYTCGEKGYLARECPHTDNFAITQNESTLPVTTQQISSIGTNLFPATNPNLSNILYLHG